MRPINQHLREHFRRGEAVYPFLDGILQIFFLSRSIYIYNLFRDEHYVYIPVMWRYFTKKKFLLTLGINKVLHFLKWWLYVGI